MEVNAPGVQLREELKHVTAGDVDGGRSRRRLPVCDRVPGGTQYIRRILYFSTLLRSHLPRLDPTTPFVGLYLKGDDFLSR